MTIDVATIVAEAEPGRQAECVIDAIKIEARDRQRRQRRERGLSARDALLALEYEALLVAVSAANLANEIELTEADRDRLMLAYQRISCIVEEAR